MMGLEAFHFLRPLWLLALPVLALIWWLIRRRDEKRREAGEFIAPHLRDALTVNEHTTRQFRAVDGVIAAAVLLTFAAAGPAWTRLPSPWFAETAPLVIALEVTDSMRSNDVQPTRLDRARFKILDLIGQRTGARTAIIAYAGSAHIVIPPSSDINVIKPLLESLDPAVMPVSGSAAASVLPLTSRLLNDDAGRGSLLFVNDGFSSADVDLLAEFTATDGAPGVAALVVGTDEGGVALLPDGAPILEPGGGRLQTGIDRELLREISQRADVSIIRLSTGEADIRALLREIKSHLARAEDPDARWLDQGWWLLWPAMLLMLFWFRRGWTMRW